jgi:hypothetical protein
LSDLFAAKFTGKKDRFWPLLFYSEKNVSS